MKNNQDQDTSTVYYFSKISDSGKNWKCVDLQNNSFLLSFRDLTKISKTSIYF